MKRRMVLLVGGALAVWLVALYPARLLGGEITTLYATVAVALCLIPTAGTLAWTARAMDRAGEQQFLMVLGGTGIRMIFVLAVGLTIYGLFPVFQQPSFWIWVLVFYLITLALEMFLLVGLLQNKMAENQTRNSMK